MPNRIVLDQIGSSTAQRYIALKSGIEIDLSQVSGHFSISEGTTEERPIYDPNIPVNYLRWNTDTNTLEYNLINEWFDVSLEEDYDFMPILGKVLHLDSYDSSSYFGVGNGWSSISKYLNVTATNVNAVVYQNTTKSFSFNSTDNYFSIASDFCNAMEDGTGSTYSFWFNSNSSLNYGSGAGDKILFSVNQNVDGTNSSPILQIGINPSGGIYYNDNSITATTVGSTNYNDNQWHNLTITRPDATGGQTSNFYVDGSSIGTLNSTNPTYSSGSIVTLGGTTSTTDLNNIVGLYGGLMSVVLVYERDLSSTEVSQMYNFLEYRYQV